MKQNYRFLREDDGKTVQVDFETMMQMDAAGYITLPDGVRARRDRQKEPPLRRADIVSATRSETGSKPIPPSDAMGFTAHQLQEFEADRQLNGFSGVEFVPDPLEPTFYQVKCSDRRTWERYASHRGFVDLNRTAAVSISAADLEAAKRLVSRALREKT